MIIILLRGASEIVVVVGRVLSFILINGQAGAEKLSKQNKIKKSFNLFAHTNKHNGLED